MAKTAEEKAAAKAAAEAADTAQPTPASKSDRKARWEAFLEQAKASNPDKYAAKEARGEFDKIPDTFV